MTIQLAVIYVTVLLVRTMVTQEWLFNGPAGELLPNNPVACTTQNVTFTCSVHDSRFTSADIWFQTNQDHPLPENATKVVDNTTRSVTLTDLTSEDHNTNMVCCVNDCTTASDIVTTQILRVFDYPVNVVDFSCVRFGWENQLKCTWSLGQTYRELPSVSVHWRIPSLTGSWKTCPKQESTQCIWNSSGSVGGRDIDVKINVTSKCDVFIYDIFSVNTSNIVKPYPVQIIQAVPVTSTSLEVRWSYPISQEMLKQFKIELSSIWNDSVEPYTQTSNQSDYNHMFSGLVPNTDYTVTARVKPITKGFWSEAAEVRVTTPKDVPFASPEVTKGGYMWDPRQCETKDKRTVYVYYKSLPKRHENGILKEVTASSQTPFYYNSMSVTEIGVPAHHTQLSVELDCGNDYNFDIRIKNEIGYAAQVSKFNIPKVTQGLKIPETIVETSGSLVHLNWSTPAGTIPTGYTAFWCKRDRGNCNNTDPVNWKQLPGNSNTVTLEISSPEEHLYSVSMETEHGSSGMRWESCIYAMNAKPKQQPETPTVSSSSKDNTLSVHWNRIECESGAPYFKFYKLVYCVWDKKIGNCSADLKELVVPASQTSVMIDKLEEDVEYGVTVQGVTADGQNGPSSEPAYGTPKQSLVSGEIIAIAAACLVGCLIIIGLSVGCYKKTKKRLKLPVIDDIPISTDQEKHPDINGFQNQNYSSSEHSIAGQTVIMPPHPPPYTNLNGLPPNLPGRPQRQDSVDSGIPEDPLTPRPTWDGVDFPDPIVEAQSVQSFEDPLTPDTIKVSSDWKMLPTGYCRVNTEEDSIPRIRSESLISDSEDNHRQTGIDIPYVANVGITFMAPETDLIVFRAEVHKDESKKEPVESKVHETEINGTGFSEPPSSYAKVSLEQSHVTYKGEVTSMTDAFVPHSGANTHFRSVDIDQFGIDNVSASNYSPNTITGNNQEITLIADKTASDTDNYIPHGNFHNSSTTSYLPNTSRAPNYHQDLPYTTASVIGNADVEYATANNTNDCLSHADMSDKSNASQSLVGGMVGVQNPASSMENDISSKSSRLVNNDNNYIHNTLNMDSCVYLETAGHADPSDYLPHGNMVNKSPVNYLPHSTAIDTDSSAVSNTRLSSSNTVNGLDQCNVVTSCSSNYTPHTAISNNGSYVSHETALSAVPSSYLPHGDMITCSPSNGMSHATASKADNNFSKKAAETVSYLPHSDVVTNPDNYMPHAAAINAHNDISTKSHETDDPHCDVVTSNPDNYMLHATAINMDSDMLLQPCKADDTTGYLPHSNTDCHKYATQIPAFNISSRASQAEAQTVSTRNPQHNSTVSTDAGSYLPHNGFVDSNQDNSTSYLPHRQVLASTINSSASQTDTFSEKAGTDSSAINENQATSIAGNYLLHDIAVTSNYLSHSDVKASNSHNNIPQTQSAGTITDDHGPHQNTEAVSLETGGCTSNIFGGYLPHSHVDVKTSANNNCFTTDCVGQNPEAVHSGSYVPHSQMETKLPITETTENTLRNPDTAQFYSTQSNVTHAKNEGYLSQESIADTKPAGYLPNNIITENNTNQCSVDMVMEGTGNPYVSHAVLINKDTTIPDNNEETVEQVNTGEEGKDDTIPDNMEETVEQVNTGEEGKDDTFPDNMEETVEQVNTGEEGKEEVIATTPSLVRDIHADSSNHFNNQVIAYTNGYIRVN